MLIVFQVKKIITRPPRNVKNVSFVDCLKEEKLVVFDTKLLRCMGFVF